MACKTRNGDFSKLVRETALDFCQHAWDGFVSPQFLELCWKLRMIFYWTYGSQMKWDHCSQGRKSSWHQKGESERGAAVHEPLGGNHCPSPSHAGCCGRRMLHARDWAMRMLLWWGDCVMRTNIPSVLLKRSIKTTTPADPDFIPWKWE